MDMSACSSEVSGKRRLSSDNLDPSQPSKHNKLESSYASTIDVEILNQELVHFKFVSNATFKTFSFVKVKDAIEAVSKIWTFITFTSNHSGCLITFDSGKAEDLLKIKLLTVNGDDLEVEFSKHLETKKKGIIFDEFLIPLEKTEILELLKGQDVFDIFKIKKNGEDTGSVILLFEKNLKDRINLGGVIRQVKELDPRPMVCVQCGLIGHTELKCKRKNDPLCKKCFEVHAEPSGCIIRCKNCGNFHKSTNPNCEAIREEVKILKIKESLGIGYIDAKNIFSDHKKFNSCEDPAKNLISEREKLKNQEITNLVDATKKLFAELAIVRESSEEKDKVIEHLNDEVVKLRVEKLQSNDVNKKLEGELLVVMNKNEDLDQILKLTVAKNTDLNNEITSLKLAVQQNESYRNGVEVDLKNFAEEITKISKTNIDSKKEIMALNEKLVQTQKKYGFTVSELEKENKLLKSFILSTPQIVQEFEKFKQTNITVEDISRKPVDLTSDVVSRPSRSSTRKATVAKATK